MPRAFKMAVWAEVMGSGMYSSPLVVRARWYPAPAKAAKMFGRRGPGSPAFGQQGLDRLGRGDGGSHLGFDEAVDQQGERADLHECRRPFVVLQEHRPHRQGTLQEVVGTLREELILVEGQ